MGKRTSWLLELNYFRYWVPSEALSILNFCSPPIALLIISKPSRENNHSESNKPKQSKVSLNNPTSCTRGQHPMLCTGASLQEPTALAASCRTSRLGWVLGPGFVPVARDAPTGDQGLPVHGANQPAFAGVPGGCFGG